MPALSTLTTTQTVFLSVLNINQEVTPFSPITATGGTEPVSYSIFPSIFSGLTFSSTGTISGKPTSLTDDIRYTITVADSGVGPDAQTAVYLFRLAVVNELLTSVVIDKVTLTATIPVSQFVPVTGSGGYGTKTWSINPPLPEGLQFDTEIASISKAARLGNTTTQYSVTILDAANYSSTGTFTLTILPFKGLEVPQPWETTGTIGTLVPGEISELYVKGNFSTSTVYTNYSLVSGSLPNGLNLNRDGTISGNAQNISSATTGISTSNFTIAITDTNNNNLLNGEFSITINQTNSSTYTAFYAKPFLPLTKRNEFLNFIRNEEIFIPSLLYRPIDPNFAKQEELKLVIDFGVEQDFLTNYATYITTNFYRRKLSLGELKTVVAKNSDGTVRHELIYVDVIDKHVNSDKISVPLEINFNDITYYPPSIPNMRARLAEYVSLTTVRNPSFTNTVQEGESIKSGYISFVPLCFTLPGKSATIIRKINESGFKFNTIDFEIDRIIVENSLEQEGAKYLLLNRSSKLA